MLEPDAWALVRLATALADHHDLVECARVAQFWEVVMSSPVDGCIVDIYHPSSPLSLTDLQRMRRRMPPLAIVVYADFRNRELDLFELGRLKIDGVLLTGAIDHPAETRRAVAGALGVVAALESQIHPLGVGACAGPSSRRRSLPRWRSWPMRSR